jgi:hypothetical protein
MFACRGVSLAPKSHAAVHRRYQQCRFCAHCGPLDFSIPVTQRPQSGRSNSELFNLWAFAPRHRCPLLRGNGSEQICNAPVAGQKTGNQFPTKAGLSARSSEAESTGWRAMCCGPPRRNAPRPRPLASWSWFCTNPSESVAPPRACSRHGVNALYSQKSQFVILPTQ